MLYFLIALYLGAALCLAAAAFISPNLALLLGALGLPILLYSSVIEPRWVKVTRQTIEIDGLAAPIKALLIGDPQPNTIHWSPASLARTFAKGVAENPDIIFWVGDYAYENGFCANRGLRDPSYFATHETIAAMAELKAPMGAYAVLGNHDWWWNGPEVLRLLGDTHITALQDDAVLARHPQTGAQLWIAGLEDASSGRKINIPSLFAQTSDAAPVIALSHSPDVLPLLPDAARLTLAGHTHGGQIGIPGLAGILAPIRNRGYVRGYVREGVKQLFVTAGMGTSGVPVRLFARPEIVILELVPKR